MKEKSYNELLVSHLNAVKVDYSRMPTWKKIPGTNCQVGFDGKNSMIRFPAEYSEATNWKIENKLIKSRIDNNNESSYLQLGFDLENIEYLSSFILQLIDCYDSSEEDIRDLLDKLLKDWSNYWLEAKPIFTKEDQVGTLGELLVLEQILIYYNSKECLGFWKAPEGKDDLHDFEGDTVNLEIKTSSTVPRKFYVDNLDQMDEKIIYPKSLIIIFVKLIPGKEITLPVIVNRIRKLCSEIGNSVEFEDILEKRGYNNNEEDIYSQNQFNLEGFDWHLVNDETPIHTSKDLIQEFDAVVSLKQTINPNKINFQEIARPEDWMEIINQLQNNM